MQEQEKRVANGSAPGGPPPPPLPLPSHSPTAKSPEDAVEMQSIESFKLKESPSPLIPKPPSTYFSLTSSTISSPTSSAGSPRHTLSPSKTQFNGTASQSVNINNGDQTVVDQKRSSPMIKLAPIPPPVVPMSTFGPGKVAVRIGAYEGEAKPPSRLDFLPQPPPRAPEPPAKVITEEVVDAPVVSRLQNELAATLQRSNLRRKTEGVRNSNFFREFSIFLLDLTQSGQAYIIFFTVKKIAN